jgi:hypothetical protein
LSAPAFGPRGDRRGPNERQTPANCRHCAPVTLPLSSVDLQDFHRPSKPPARRLKIMVSWFQGDTAHKASVAADACPPKRPAASTTFSPAKSAAAERLVEPSRSRQKCRQKISRNRSRASEPRIEVLSARNEVPAKAHGLPSRVTRPRGFEPLTFGSVDRRSIQLSYGRKQRLRSVAAASGEGGIRTRDGDCLPILA